MISDDQLRRVLSKSSVALLGDLIRASLWTIFGGAWIFYGAVYVRMVRLALENQYGSDFAIFYVTGRMVADGLPMYGASPLAYGVTWEAGHLGNLNPPLFQLLFSPIAAMAYKPALLTWAAISLVAVVASILIAVKELKVPLTWKRLYTWGAVTMGLTPFVAVAITHELTFLLMLPFTLMWRAWRRGAWGRAGAWLGICITFKLFFLLFVPVLLLQRRWRALAACAAATGVLAGIGIAIYGVDTYRLWVGSLGKVDWWWLSMNASWQGFVSRTIGERTTMTPVWPGESVLRLVATAGGLIICAITVLATRRPGEAPESRDRDVLLVLAGAILASPLGWVYCLPLAWAPVIGLFGAGLGWHAYNRQATVAKIVAVVALVFLFFPKESADSGQPSVLATLTLASTYFYATAAVWLVLLWWRRHRSGLEDDPLSVPVGLAPSGPS